MWPTDEGVTLSAEDKAKRLLCIRKNFECGHPLSHIDDYQLELEQFHGTKLPHSSHLGKYVIYSLLLFMLQTCLFSQFGII
jgi:hypothetical protein